MQIEISEEHFAKALSPMRSSFDPESNWTTESELQSEKQQAGRTVTVEGMKTDFSDGHFSKADSPMTSSFEPDSNRSSEKEMQPEKQ
jgi:hypothetical protein